MTLDQQIACVRREIALRKRVYPRWVESGRMKKETADREIDCMQAVHDTLAALREQEQ
jgi:signal recognition particle subunit SEC65